MVIKTFDELLTQACDEYDKLIAPKKIFRDDSNAIYLILKSLCKGFEINVNTAANIVNNKFLADKCEDFDLDSLASITGTQRIPGKGSGLVMYVTNEGSDAIALLSGEYFYQYDATTKFLFTINNGTYVYPGESKMLVGFTDILGSFRVTAQTTIAVKRTDDAVINPELLFSCLDNESYLGRVPETNFEFRRRILTDVNRQDIFSEMETAIKTLPRILDCKIIFNGSEDALLVDGEAINPYHFLLIINGDVTDDVAGIVARYGFYPSTQAVGGAVCYFHSDIFHGGAYPVYYRPFGFFDYNIALAYSYDDRLTANDVVQREIASKLAKLQFPSGYSKYVTEEVFYDLLKEVTTPSFAILDVKLLNGTTEVPYVEVPGTRYPRLATITYNGVST
jgi:hypothetical protein